MTILDDDQLNTESTLSGTGTVNDPLRVSNPGITSVTHDATLTGGGTIGSPLSVVPSGGSLTVKEIDGVPTVLNVTTIQVSNGTLTDNGGGQVTVTTSGGGGSSLEVTDGITDVPNVDKITFPSGSVTDDGGGDVSIAFTGGGGPAGANSQIQFNDSGNFGASGNFTYQEEGDPFGDPLVSLGNFGTMRAGFFDGYLFTNASGNSLDIGDTSGGGSFNAPIYIASGSSGFIQLLADGGSTGSLGAGQILLASGPGGGQSAQILLNRGGNIDKGSIYLQTGLGNSRRGDVSIPLGNLVVGTTSDQTTQVAGAVILRNTTAPSGSVANAGILFVEGGALKYRGSAGTVSTIAPA